MKRKPALSIFFIAYLISFYLFSILFQLKPIDIYSMLLLSSITFLFVLATLNIIKKQKKYSFNNSSKNLRKRNVVTYTKTPVKDSKINITDIEKREFFLQFIKFAGSLSLGTLFLSLFTKNAQALQFGGTGIPDPIGVEPLGNTQTTSSTTLTNADTWYQVPSTNQSSRIFLVLNNRSGHDMYWTFDNTVNASTGGLLFPSGGNLMFDAGNAVNVYVRCGTAGQVCWYAESQSQ